jgi:hypothetical protein
VQPDAEECKLPVGSDLVEYEIKPFGFDFAGIGIVDGQAKFEGLSPIQFALCGELWTTRALSSNGFLMPPMISPGSEDS